MIAGTGGTTGQPKGVMLPGRNLEAMSALTLMSYPFEGRPVYLALAPLTHAAGVLCLPIMTLGGRIVIMPKPDIGEFLRLIARQARDPHVPAADADLHAARTSRTCRRPICSSLQCFWYGAAPMSAAGSSDALVKIGPVMGQLFGQTEAPMMISTMAPKDHFNADGSVARGAPEFGRAADAARSARDHGRPRAPAAARRARRNRHPRLAGHGGLLQEPGGDRRSLAIRLATTPATSAISTTRTIFSSSIAPRT